jgi:Fe2+ or Zn2+ uptake regulation protein
MEEGKVAAVSTGKGMTRSRRVVRQSAPMDVDATIAQVGTMLRARGERMTGPRRAVLTVLARDGGHLSAEAVLTRVADQDPSVHRASVYRTLEALSELGVVQHVHVGHGVTAYHLVRGERAHPHAQCRSCGAVHDLPADLLDTVAAVLARRHGFQLDAGHVALSGVCTACSGMDAHSTT